MSMTDKVRSAMVAAMKASDKETKESLSLLLSALKNKAIDKRADLTEEEEIQVVLKEIKQTKETLELTPETGQTSSTNADSASRCLNSLLQR